MSLWGYLRKQLIAIDQLFNTAAGGEPDETISSRLGRDQKAGDEFAGAACKVLDVFEKDHCAISVEFDANGNPDAHHLGKRVQHSDVSMPHGQMDRGRSLSEVGPQGS